MNISAVLTIVQAITAVFSRGKKIRDVVLPLVEQAAGMADLGNDGRREFVVAELLKQGLSESDARLLTEAGVKLWKKLQAKLAKKAAKKQPAA